MKGFVVNSLVDNVFDLDRVWMEAYLIANLHFCFVLF